MQNVEYILSFLLSFLETISQLVLSVLRGRARTNLQTDRQTDRWFCHLLSFVGLRSSFTSVLNFQNSGLVCILRKRLIIKDYFRAFQRRLERPQFFLCYFCVCFPPLYLKMKIVILEKKPTQIFTFRCRNCLKHGIYVPHILS